MSGEAEVPIYAPFFGVMGAASAIIFSGKCMCMFVCMSLFVCITYIRGKNCTYIYRCTRRNSCQTFVVEKLLIFWWNKTMKIHKNTKIFQ